MKDKISIIEYLDILQKEWIQFFWAYNKFPERYLEKYKKLMSDREVKILDITKKIMVSNIFNDPTTTEKVFDEIFQKGGVPVFLYRNNETCEKIHHFNMVYFYVHSSVIFEEEEYIVNSISSNFKTLSLSLNNSKKGLSVDIADVKHNFKFKDFVQWM